MNLESLLGLLAGVQVLTVLCLVGLWALNRHRPAEVHRMLESFEQKVQGTLGTELTRVADSLSLRMNDQIEKAKSQFSVQHTEIQSSLNPLKTALGDRPFS
jgi:hypothetical protein